MHASAPITDEASYVADLQYHMNNKVCWQHYDMGLLDEWETQASTFCAPVGGAVDGVGPSSLTCRVMVDTHLPVATRPHTSCDGENIAMDFGVLRPAKCPKFRPGYKCGPGGPIHYHYPLGALKGACVKSPEFNNNNFPKDHLRDIFASWQTVPSAAAFAGVPVADAPVTLFITRERLEHANLFHATTDFINAFEALHMARVINVHREGDRTGVDQVQVMLLDEQDEGPFDAVLQKVFSPRFPVVRPSTIRGGGTQQLRRGDDSKRRVFPRAVFAPPGYTNFLFSHLDTRGDCRTRLQLLESFRLFVLNGLGIPAPSRPPSLRVVFISRKPYTKFVEHKFVGRQVTNEPELMDALNAMPDVSAQLVDFVHLKFEEQLAMVANTDVLIGMHGAALAHAVYLPPWAGVLELWPKDRDMWRCFEHLSEMAGLVYRRWENKNTRAFSKDRNGDYTRVDPQQFTAVAADVLSKVKARRASG